MCARASYTVTMVPRQPFNSTCHEIHQRNLLLRIGTVLTCSYYLALSVRELLHITSDKKARHSVMILVCTVYLCAFIAIYINGPAENVTQWTQHSTDISLKERVADIQTWRQTITKTLQDTENEISLLSHQ